MSFHADHGVENPFLNECAMTDVPLDGGGQALEEAEAQPAVCCGAG